MNPASPPSGYKEPKGVPWVEFGIGVIFLVLLLLVLTPGCGRGQISRRTPNALSNIKQADLAVIMFENDYDDSAPEMIDIPVFQGMIRPYTRSVSICFDPDTGRAFIPNPKLSHVNTAKLASPADTIMLFDADVVNGKRIVAYADGHARSIDEAEFQKEIVADPHAVPSLGLYEGSWQTSGGKITIDEKGVASLKQANRKIIKGTAEIGQKDHLTISFANKAPAVEGDVTWISLNRISLQKKAGAIILNRLSSP